MTLNPVFEQKGEVSIIIPVYNEAEVIGSTVSELAERFPFFEILVVDDGSQDGSGKIAAEAGARVVSHPRNRGNGAAIKTGIRSAKGRILVMMDGDGQHDPNEIPKILEHIENYEMVVGARDFKNQGQFHRSWANRFYSRFATYLADHKVEDLTSGFRAVHRKLALRFAYLLPNTFSYPSTITLAFFKAGYGVKYVPIYARKRVGKSKLRIFKDGLRFFAILIKIVSLFNPMKVFFPLGMFFFAPGLAYTIYRLSLGHRLTNPMVLSLSAAVLIFALGLISEQIALLRLERIDEPPPSESEEELNEPAGDQKQQ
ncbi:MAG: glycosyltransferase family 2 protein [Deltaproteobacteria bacterium]|nr:glycosyltransferase family 2 protein [Deltaproteobacteria bacterium]